MVSLVSVQNISGNNAFIFGMDFLFYTERHPRKFTNLEQRKTCYEKDF